MAKRKSEIKVGDLVSPVGEELLGKFVWPQRILEIKGTLAFTKESGKAGIKIDLLEKCKVQ